MSRKMGTIRADGYFAIRSFHRSKRGKRDPRFLFKCGCCDGEVEVYYGGDSLEINGVMGSVENWRRFQLRHAMKDAPAKALLREVAKEPFHHVEPGRAGGGEVHVEASAPSEPAFHLGMFVRGVVIHDEMHFAVRRRLSLDEAQEAQPFLVPVLAHAGSHHSPVQGIEGGKQRGRAMPLIVVGHGLALAFFQRQAGLSPIQGLDLALFIQRQDQGVLGRVQIQPHDLFQLLGKLRVVTELETPYPMRFQSVRSPNPPLRGFTHPSRPLHASRAPVRCLRGGLLGGLADDLFHPRCRKFGLASRSRSVLLDARQTALDKPLAPAGHPLTPPSQGSSNLFVLSALRGQQNHLGSLPQSARQTATPRPRFKLLSLFSGQSNRRGDSHVVLLFYQTRESPISYIIYDALH